jgi:hypothetical protein
VALCAGECKTDERAQEPGSWYTAGAHRVALLVSKPVELASSLCQQAGRPINQTFQQSYHVCDLTRSKGR